MAEPLVSICCVTYNQETYIRDAIEGFLMQKCTFPYEILIHDDASTDGTSKIIKNYAASYPALIFPIYQTENQYSKKEGSLEARFVWPNARGKYIAVCEGDDYWTDSGKLQKQVDLLEANPDCSLCFHNAIITFVDKSKRDRHFCKDFKNKQVFGTKDLILKIWFVPTASIMFRKSDKPDFPDWIKEVFNDDLALQSFLSLKGNLIYIDEIMSVYRRYALNSLSAVKRNPTFWHDNLIFFYLNFNKYTKAKYKRYIWWIVTKLYIQSKIHIVYSMVIRVLDPWAE